MRNAFYTPPVINCRRYFQAFPQPAVLILDRSLMATGRPEPGTGHGRILDRAWRVWAGRILDPVRATDPGRGARSGW